MSVLAGTRAGDPVDCTVFGPASIGRRDTAFIQAFAHLFEQAAYAEALAQEFDPSTSKRGLQRLSTHVNHGERLSFELIAPGLTVDDPHAELTWSGRAESVQFEARVPENGHAGAVICTVLVSHHTVPIGKIKFRIAVSDRDHVTLLSGSLGEEASAFKRAFISYATADREAVLGYTQLLRAVGIDYFQDVVSLEPGARWERRLQDSIPEADLFLLFWSSQASASEWVRREVAMALQAQGDESDPRPPQIRPVILEGPPAPPPWPELQHLHFNDPLLYFRAEAR